MVRECSICNGSLKKIEKVEGSIRGNIISICNNCAVIQSAESSSYDATTDPHSLQFVGERHISDSEGAMWGNIRHGKGLRFDAHRSLLERIFLERSPENVFDDGSNRGHFARFAVLQPSVKQYVGCEPDPICSESYENNGTPEILNCYSEQYNSETEFDLIYSSHTLEHVNSVKGHLLHLSKLLRIGGTFFLDLPNTHQINFEDTIYEEYFVEKHRSHFMVRDIVDIFDTLGYQIDFIASDPYNITMTATLLKRTPELLENLMRPAAYIEEQVGNVKKYFQKYKNNKDNFLSICKNLNNFKKEKKIILYGGGRLLKGFLSMGLSELNIDMVIDNYLYDKTKRCGNLELSHEGDLLKMPNDTPVVIFARSSTIEIKKRVSEAGFSKIFDFKEFK
jgi:hypothetical protein